MTLVAKRYLIAVLSGVFLLSLVFVQWLEIERRKEESGHSPKHVSVPALSEDCVDCHVDESPAIIAHWKGSTHAEVGVACVACHQAERNEADSYEHYGVVIATIVTPKDCARCHAAVAKEFEGSHHAKGGQILASLDNYLAETVEGARVPFNPHSKTPGMEVDQVNGMASAISGCKQCHGSKVGLMAKDGSVLTVEDFKPDKFGVPTHEKAVERIQRDDEGKPVLATTTWPNTGIGRINLDGSLGSCSACHSRHDFSPRRARQPENCGKCHLGPDHPQKEIYEESKHGVAYRDLKDQMNLDAEDWVLGEDYAAAPTCATCHMSANTRNGRMITHDPGIRISWTNRPPVSLLKDTDKEGKLITEEDPEKRKELIAMSWQERRANMKEVCSHCHTPNYVNAFYEQYDDFVILYNEKFAKPGKAIMSSLKDGGLITEAPFDEEVEWTWFYLWHHEGRRARHGASMMAPDYAHWHGMFEVAERFYVEFIPQVREIAEEAKHAGKGKEAKAVTDVVDEILSRPEHQWFEKETSKMEWRKRLRESY